MASGNHICKGFPRSLFPPTVYNIITTTLLVVFWSKTNLCGEGTSVGPAAICSRFHHRLFDDALSLLIYLFPILFLTGYAFRSPFHSTVAHRVILLEGILHQHHQRNTTLSFLACAVFQKSVTSFIFMNNKIIRQEVANKSYL